MKNYRLLIAIAVTLLMVVSFYTLLDASVEKDSQLKRCVDQAETLAEEGLIGKAVEKYHEAIELKSDIAYYHAIMDLYFENEEIESSIAWGEETISVFPNDPTGYECLLRAYFKDELYKDAYKTLEAADGRSVRSDLIEQYRTQMKSLYYTSYIALDDISQNSGGYLVVQKKGKWGVISSAAKTIIKPAYEKIGAFANGMVAVYDDDGCWYFAEKDGVYAANISLHVEGNITDVGIYNEEKFAVCADGVYKYYDLEFNELTDGYDYAGAFNNGVAAVKRGSMWFIVDGNGDNLTDVGYELIVLDDRGICCLGDRIIVKQNGKYILLDSAGNRVGTAEFEEARLPAGGDWIAVKQNGKWGFADLNGKMVIEPQYDDAYSFSNGYAAICLGGLWGFIDESNYVCVEPIYTRCCNMTEAGTAFVQSEQSWDILKLYSKHY